MYTILRNAFLVLATYLSFIAFAFCVLPQAKLPAFALLALPGAIFALDDAVNLAGAVREGLRLATLVTGVLALIFGTAWFLTRFGTAFLL